MSRAVHRIVVGVHDSASSRWALRWAAQRSAAGGVQLHVVTAVADAACGLSPEGLTWYVPRIPVDDATVGRWQERLVRSIVGASQRAPDQRESRDTRDPHDPHDQPDQRGAPAARLLDGSVSIEVRPGSAAEVLRRAARDADLLVIGATGRRRFARITPRVLGPLPCPVKVIDRIHVG